MTKKKKRPTSVTVMGIPFTVLYQPSVVDPDDKDKEELSGLTTGAQRLIQISTSVNTTKELIEATLLHETIHAILYVSGMSEMIQACDPTEDDKLEEGIVVALENGISQIYKRNY